MVAAIGRRQPDTAVIDPAAFLRHDRVGARRQRRTGCERADDLDVGADLLQLDTLLRLRPGIEVHLADAQREQQELERRIEQIEERIAEIESTLADPALYAADADSTRPAALAAEREQLATELADAYAAWERVGEELAGV